MSSVKHMLSCNEALVAELFWQRGKIGSSFCMTITKCKRSLLNTSLLSSSPVPPLMARSGSLFEAIEVSNCLILGCSSFSICVNFDISAYGTSVSLIVQPKGQLTFCSFCLASSHPQTRLPSRSLFQCPSSPQFQSQSPRTDLSSYRSPPSCW
jgi:hypothetical protein